MRLQVAYVSPDESRQIAVSFRDVGSVSSVSPAGSELQVSLPWPDGRLVGTTRREARR